MVYKCYDKKYYDEILKSYGNDEPVVISMMCKKAMIVDDIVKVFNDNAYVEGQAAFSAKCITGICDVLNHINFKYMLSYEENDSKVTQYYNTTSKNKNFDKERTIEELFNKYALFSKILILLDRYHINKAKPVPDPLTLDSLKKEVASHVDENMVVRKDTFTYMKNVEACIEKILAFISLVYESDHIKEPKEKQLELPDVDIKKLKII